MNTKERILDEALTLFSERGYSAVSVGEIASAVGIRAPSLYKHFVSKQEIFDSCVNEFSQRMREVRDELHLTGSPQSGIDFKSASEKQITDIAVRLFLFYLTDSVASRFRKMLMIERYHNPKLNDLFDDLFISGAVEYEEKIFSGLIEAGVIKKEDPHLIALRFYTPVFYLLQKYDLCPEQTKKATRELRQIVKEFCRTYGNS